MTATIKEAARVLWDFCLDDRALEYPYDFLFLLCSNDESVVERVVELWDMQSFRFVLVSGGYAHSNDLLQTEYDTSEAEHFAKLLNEKGVPISHMVLECHAENTGENFSLSKKLLESREIEVTSGLMVQKPHMEKRCIATAKIQWPDLKWGVTSRSVGLEEYAKERGEDALLSVLVGDAWRLMSYPNLGFQAQVEYGNDIKEAIAYLSGQGFDKHLPNNWSLQV